MVNGTVFCNSRSLHFEISLPSFLQICISWLAEMTMECCQHVLTLPRWCVCRKCVAIAAVVNFDQEGPFQQAGRYVFKLCLLYDIDVHEFGQFHYPFVKVHGA